MPKKRPNPDFHKQLKPWKVEASGWAGWIKITCGWCGGLAYVQRRDCPTQRETGIWSGAHAHTASRLDESQEVLMTKFTEDLYDDLRKLKALAKVEINDLNEAIDKIDKALGVLKSPRRERTKVTLKVGDGVVAGSAIGKEIKEKSRVAS